MSQVLLSEGFERAAYALVHAFESFRGLDTTKLRTIINQFEESVLMMKRSVAVLAEIKALDQCNMDRERHGQAPAYNELDYMKVIDQL